MRSLVLAAVVVTAIGCCPKRQTVKVDRIDRACVEEAGPPPTSPGIATTREGCPPGMVCYLAADAKNLIRYIRSLRDWMDIATRDCLGGQ